MQHSQHFHNINFDCVDDDVVWGDDDFAGAFRDTFSVYGWVLASAFSFQFENLIELNRCNGIFLSDTLHDVVSVIQRLLAPD